MRHVGAALRKRWGVGLLILGGLLIEMAFNSAVPMSFKYLVDDAIVPRNEKVLFAILAGLTGGVVVVSAVGLGCDYLYAKFTTGVLNDLRWRMFTHLQRLAMNFFARSQAADILARFSTDLAAFENALELAVVELRVARARTYLERGPAVHAQLATGHHRDAGGSDLSGGTAPDHATRGEGWLPAPSRTRPTRPAPFRKTSRPNP